MKNLADYSAEELKLILASHPPYRAGQLFKWVAFGAQYEEMSTLPLALREELKKEYADTAVKIIKQIKSADKSVKLLFELNDGNAVEGIYMPHSYGNTLCVSTQVGCRMGCIFCASHIGGMARNLTAGEIYSQVIAANKMVQLASIEAKPQNAYSQNSKNQNQRAVSKIVLMGSGEPLDNYDNTVKFIKLACDPQGLNLSQRGISLSTAGLPDQMRQLADEGCSINLSVSLHATTDEVRQSLMPIAKKYTIKQVTDAAKYYFDKTGRRVSIEYVLIKGVNMSFFDAKRLKELTKNMSCHINLIMLNHVCGSNLTPCTKPEAERFLKRLTDLNLSATLRKSAGAGADGACGQLRGKFVGEKTNKNDQK